MYSNLLDVHVTTNDD